MAGWAVDVHENLQCDKSNRFPVHRCIYWNINAQQDSQKINMLISNT